MEKMPAESGPNHGRFGDGPGFAGVGGTEHARDFSSSGEPYVGAALNGDAGSAGGERAFAFEGGRKFVGCKRCPVLATVFGCDQFKIELARIIGDRISERDAVIAIPERHAIEKAFGILVGELQSPVFAGVGGFVNARLIAGTSTQQVGEVGAEGFHIAEVERFCARNLRGLPGISSIGGAEIGSVSTAGPGNLVGDGANPAKVFGGVGFLDGRVLGQKGCSKQQEYVAMRAHAMIVPEGRQAWNDLHD